MACEEQNSLEYIEDPYFNPEDSTTTPSLDELDNAEYLDDEDLLESEFALFDLRQLEFDEFNCNSLNSDESINVEAEFFITKKANDIIRRFFKGKLKKQVRVTYCDLTKPYLAKLPKDSNFRKFLDITNNENGEPIPFGEAAADTSDLTDAERQQKEAEWRAELNQIEEEIATLRAVLTAKLKTSAELKRNLGITVWRELSEDVNQGFKNVKESNVYQTVESKVGQVTKAVTDAPIYQKTTSLIGGFTGNITNKIGQMRHSDSFRSIEEKVGTAYENVKTKVSNVSRSGSLQSLDEAGRSRSGSIATSPAIPEDKPIA